MFKVLLTLLGITFAVRLIILFDTPLNLYSDDAIYAKLGQFFLQGHADKLFHPTWSPLYPFFSALVFVVIRHWEISLRLVSILSGMAILIPLYFLAKSLMRPLFSIIFLVSLILTAPIAKYSLLPLSDMLSTTLTISAIVAMFLGMAKQNPKLFILAAFLFGLNYLTRPEGLMFFLLSVGYLLFYFLCRRKLNTRSLTTFFILCIVFILTISPYVVSMRAKFGFWTLSHKFSAQMQQGEAFALNSRGSTWSQEVVSVTSPDLSSPYFKNGLIFTLNRFDFFRWWFNQKLAVWQEVYFNLFPLWTVPFILLGLLHILQKQFYFPLGYIIFIMIISVPMTIFSTAIADVRYLLWTVPLLLFFYWLGWQSLSSKVKFAAILAVLSLILLPAISWQHQKLVFPFNKPGIKEAGIWIKDHSSNPKPKIMARHEGFEVYGDGETIYIPQIHLEELIKFAKKMEVDYIIAWSDELTSDEKLISLLDEKRTPAALKINHIIKKTNSKIIIYSLKNF